MNHKPITEKYLSRLRERCFFEKSDQLSVIYESSTKIFLFLVESRKPSNLKHLTFSRLKEIAQYPKDFPIQNFKLILAILSDERVNILVEIFEAHNIETDESIILSFNEVTDFILENKFINPFTEEEISELEFSKMITTFFSISEELLGDLNVH
ncbi:hypothetical protein SLJ90_13700 [Acinetobacter pittii]|uniref:hypothetical protein n=1 Tax=Acinetobacter pittii TaxID=48296 RepID=UPI00037D8696|nr:hypothetical protein [Acinetobacter pittii]MDX8275804.1 hypothetical protein [Acinetobacter pittii]SSP30568.1 Uncharacterised protein [Acinetobacter pittii]